MEFAKVVLVFLKRCRTRADFLVWCKVKLDLATHSETSDQNCQSFDVKLSGVFVFDL